MRLNIIALSAAFEAGILVDQKLINKKEHIPTPSQPNSKTHKFEDVTRTTIKNVKRAI